MLNFLGDPNLKSSIFLIAKNIKITLNKNKLKLLVNQTNTSYLGPVISLKGIENN
jgi:hypothetical protein